MFPEMDIKKQQLKALRKRKGLVWVPPLLSRTGSGIEYVRCGYIRRKRI